MSELKKQGASLVENKEEDRSGKNLPQLFNIHHARVKLFPSILATIWQHMRIIIAPTGFLGRVGP